MTITIKSEEFTALIHSCLKDAFGDQHSDTDVYNTEADYIVIYCGNEIASIGRLTKCPNGIFFTWSNGSSNFSNTIDTLDLGRCMVSKKFRGGSYYDLLITYCFKYAYNKGYKYVNGASVLGRQMVDRLPIYGFAKIGNELSISHTNGKEYQIQAYTTDLEKTIKVWTKILNDTLEAFKKEGYNIIEQVI